MIRKIAWVLSILSAVIMVAVTVLVLPDTVPVHYNFAGEADNWGSKWTYAVFAFVPLLLLVIYEFYRRKRREHPNFKMEEKLIPVIAMFFIPIFWLSFPFSSEQRSMDVRFFCAVVGVMGLLMIFLANYMGKIRQNPHLGIRIPWTLKNETVWNRTHRLGGITGVLGGSVMVVGSIIAACNIEQAFAWCIASTIAGIILTVLIPTVYSIVLYRKLEKEGKL